MRVLVAPAHIYLTPLRGSEAAWAYNIVSRIAENFNVQVDAICGRSDKVALPPNVKTFEIGFNKGDLISRGLFYYRCFSIAKKLYKNADLIHHMLPFGFKAGFNPLAVFNHLKNKPFVIGPIQSPPEFSDITDYMLWTGRTGLNAEVLYFFENTLKALTSRPLSIMHELTLREAEALIFISARTLKLYEKFYSDILKDKILKIIPPGVETDHFRYSPPPKKDHILLLTVGRLLKKKGIQYLIMAMPLILKEHKNIKLMIVGDGPYKINLIRLVKQLSLQEYVEFRGHVPRYELPNLYSLSDIYIQPSLYGGFSASMEAMSCGRPVIATDMDYVTEYVHDGVNGIVIKRADIETIASSVCRLLNDEDLRLRMGLNARKYAEEVFDWNRIVRKWHEIYEKIIRGN